MGCFARLDSILPCFCHLLPLHEAVSSQLSAAEDGITQVPSVVPQPSSISPLNFSVMYFSFMIFCAQNLILGSQRYLSHLLPLHIFSVIYFPFTLILELPEPNSR